MTEPKLLPCPFCGSSAETILTVMGVRGRCLVCEAVGPARECDQFAIEAWNTRTNPSPPIDWDFKKMWYQLREIVNVAGQGSLLKAISATMDSLEEAQDLITKYTGAKGE